MSCDDEIDDPIDLDREIVYDSYGRRITEADAEAAADACERGDFDITEAIYPRHGKREQPGPGETLV